jgi:hypothetical protein
MIVSDSNFEARVRAYFDSDPREPAGRLILDLYSVARRKQESTMAGSVPRAIVELELMRERVQNPEVRNVVEVLLRLLTGTDLDYAGRQYVQHYFSPEEQRVFDRAVKNATNKLSPSS